nr:TetR/AcrR family transcriptional regulator [uncultured Duganella sp.]
MTTVKRGRGRPKKLEAVDLLLSVGRELLLTYGLRITVDAIVMRAKVAKTTFYTYFADKEAFIEAVLRRESDRTISDAQFSAAQRADLRSTLVEFGIRYLCFANEHQLLGWDKLIASANDLYPAFAQRLFDAGPGRGYTLLTFIQRRAQRDGQLRMDDAAAAAEDLVALWYGTKILRVNLRVCAPMDQEEIAARARRGVALFLRLYATGAGAAAD